MKRILLLLGAGLCVPPTVLAAEADTSRGISVFDANPRCMERTVDPNDPACIVKSEGAPRQFYPVDTLTPVLPGAPVMPSSPPPVSREGTRNPVRQGG